MLSHFFWLTAKNQGYATTKNKINKLYLERDDRVDSAGADVGQDDQLVSGLLKD